MGIGNFYLKNAHTVYVDDEHIYDDEYDHDENAFRFDDLKHNTLSCLPSTFTAHTYTDYQDDCLIIAESGLFVVTMKEWEGYVAINLAIKESILQGPTRGLAEHHHTPQATKIFDALAELYPLRVRCCAWTSGEYVISNAKVA